jgi:outer membrane lipoprotein-sorting protein
VSGTVLLLVVANTVCPADSMVARWTDALEANGQHVVATQELYWPLTDDRLTRTMEVWFLPPNLVHVTYSAPDSQLIIADGEHIWTVVPDNNQVLVQLQDPTATWRDTPLGKMLSVETFACSSTTVCGEDAGVSLVCTNLQGTSEFTEVKLFVPDGREWPSLARLVDISGNVTSYRILEWETPPSETLDETLFRPAVPEGMEVVHLE